jgi:type II secretory pathway pseudopilin PulG
MIPRERCHFSACSLSRPFPAGFTLMETMIVFLLLGIFTMLGLPSLNASLEHHRLSGAASEVVTALEFAQLTAMTSGRKTRVSISPTFNTIYVRRYKPSADLFTGGDELVAGDVESETWEYMQYPLKKGSEYVIELAVEDRFRGVDITASDFHILNPVYFNTLGGPSHGGTATLTLGSRQMVVTLDALTGKVTVSE